MNSKNLLKIKKFNRVYSLTKYFFLLENSFVLFQINVLNSYVKFYIKQFFSKYCYKLFYVSKRNYFVYSFKSNNFVLIQFKNLEYLNFFVNFDFNFFELQDSVFIFIAIKLKKNVLFYSFFKKFILEKNTEFISFFIFFMYFYILFKRIFLIKITFNFNYIFLLNNLLFCQQFIKLPLN